ncbi:MAG: hypothetical protein ACHQDD_03960 [Steroidobacterales bacterium]
MTGSKRATILAMHIALLFAARTGAQSIVVQPRVSTGLQDYQLRFDDVITPLPNGGTDIRGGFKVADTITFVGGGINVAYERFFVDASGQWSQNGTDHNQQIEGNAIGNGVFTSGDGQNHNSDVSLRRQELNLSLGWAATPEFSVYAGYKYAKVDLTQHLSPILTPPPLVNTATGQDGNVLFFGDYLMNFTYNGGFIGATYAVPVGSVGAVALQSSLARLDGVFRQHFTGNVFVTNPAFPNNLRPIDGSFKDGQVDGISFGLNLGISWSGNFAWISAPLQRLVYTIGVDESQYRFDSGKSKSLWAADLQEKNTRARFELRYRFGGAGG